MNCETFRDRVFEFLDGTLADGASFEAHRAQCAGCQGLLAGIERNERVLSEAPLPTAPPDLWPRIAAAIGRERVNPFRRRRIAFLAAAAAVLLLAGLLVASLSASRKAPALHLVVVDVGPELQRTFRSFAPRYEDVDPATATLDASFRSDR